MNIFDAINELALAAGIGRVVPDETGSVTLLFDGVHEVTFMQDSDDGAVYFQCEMGDASRLGSDGCRALLEASFSETDGAAFAIHPVLDKIVLWKRFGEFASRTEVQNSVNGFLGTVIDWKARLASGDFAVNDAVPASPMGFLGSFLQA